MKKLNTKKLNQYFMNAGNSPEMKSLVEKCAENFIHSETKNPISILVLNDLGLLLEV